MALDGNAGQNYNIKIGNKCFENVRRTIIWPVVLYGCYTSYVTMGEEMG